MEFIALAQGGTKTATPAKRGYPRVKLAPSPFAKDNTPKTTP